MSLNGANKDRMQGNVQPAGVSHKARESYMAINLGVKHGRLSYNVCNDIYPQAAAASASV